MRLRPQAARLLGLFLREPGRLVTRAEIRDHLWVGVTVEFEQGINACIRQLRDALGDDADNPAYVGTDPAPGLPVRRVMDRRGGFGDQPAVRSPCRHRTRRHPGA